MGAGLGVGMGVAMGGAIGSAFGQIATNNLDHSNELITCPNCKSFNNSKTKFCSNCGLNLEVVPQMAKINITCDKCGASLSKTAKFCHNCADEVNPCPECGDDNSKQAKKCKNCGIDLPLICSNCNASVDKDFKFPDYP
jgi:predicted amidophosphoribosyltransferase